MSNQYRQCGRPEHWVPGGGPTKVGSAPSGTGLEAQLAKYEVQLADWVSCPSGKTPEGKAKITAISNHIADIKQRMKAVDNASNGSANGREVDSNQSQPAPFSGVGQPGGSLLGTRVDVYA